MNISIVKFANRINFCSKDEDKDKPKKTEETTKPDEGGKNVLDLSLYAQANNARAGVEMNKNSGSAAQGNPLEAGEAAQSGKQASGGILRNMRLEYSCNRWIKELDDQLTQIQAKIAKGAELDAFDADAQKRISREIELCKAIRELDKEKYGHFDIARVQRVPLGSMDPDDVREKIQIFNGIPEYMSRHITAVSLTLFLLLDRLDERFKLAERIEPTFINNMKGLDFFIFLERDDFLGESEKERDVRLRWEQNNSKEGSIVERCDRVIKETRDKIAKLETTDKAHDKRTTIHREYEGLQKLLPRLEASKEVLRELDQNKYGGKFYADRVMEEIMDCDEEHLALMKNNIAVLNGLEDTLIAKIGYNNTDRNQIRAFLFAGNLSERLEALRSTFSEDMIERMSGELFYYHATGEMTSKMLRETRYGTDMRQYFLEPMRRASLGMPMSADKLTPYDKALLGQLDPKAAGASAKIIKFPTPEKTT